MILDMLRNRCEVYLSTWEPKESQRGKGQLKSYTFINKYSSDYPRLTTNVTEPPLGILHKKGRDLGERYIYTVYCIDVSQQQIIELLVACLIS